MAEKKSRKSSKGVKSNALDLEAGIFTFDDPRKIALSLKRSAEHSTRRRGSSFQSAMSMLNLYLNRAGTKLPAERRKIPEVVKDEIGDVYGRPRQQKGCP